MASKPHPPYSLTPTKKSILLVGGGTGGHIFPLYPLAEKLLQGGHTVHLVVNDAALDRKVIEDKFIPLTSLPLGGTEEGLKVHYLKTNKIDYHLSWRNLVAPFKILVSFWRTKKLLKNIKPDIVFFKGGFVGFPVLIALKYLISKRWWERAKTRNSRKEENIAEKRTFLVRVREYFSSDKEVRRFSSFPKIYLHDSDISAGKLTQLIGKNADHVFTNFGPSATPLFYWPRDLDPGIKQKPAHKKSRDQRPQVLIFGGSQGAQFLNNLIVHNIEELTDKFNITLVAGPKNQIDTSSPFFKGSGRSGAEGEGFKVVNFMPQDDLIQAMIQSDLVICRSGASMFQVLAAKIPCIAIPLPTSARNHQYDNAQYFAEQGLCYLLEQNTQTSEKLVPIIEQVLEDKKLKQKLAQYQGSSQIQTIIQTITT